MLAGRVVGPVFLQVRQYVTICVDDLKDQLRSRVLVVPPPEASAEALDLEVAGVEHEAHHRLLVIGIASDVGHHHESRLRLSARPAARQRRAEPSQEQRHRRLMR